MTGTRQKFVDDMREVLARLKEMRTEISQTDDIAQAFALDETGKSVVYRYCVKLLNDCLIHGVNVEDEFYMDSMADYLEQQLTLFNSAYADNVTAACISIHAHAAVAQNGEKKLPAIHGRKGF